MSISKKTLLITGDWFIDEYWFVTRHNSSLSSHTGQIHYRIYSEEGDPVKDLCGAGLVARVIYDIREAQGSAATANFHIIGLGSWHPLDRDLIAHFIHAQCRQREREAAFGSVICNSYALQPRTCEETVKVTLYNLQDPQHPYPERQRTKLTSGVTVRVIRSYRFDGSQFQQLSRIDWEPKPNTLPDNKTSIPPIIKSINNQLNGSSLSIVVEDHNRRQFDSELTQALSNLNSSTPIEWYIRSKNRATFFSSGQQPWIDSLASNGHKHKVLLLAIGPEISVRGQPAGRLMAANRKLTRNVFESINAIKSRRKLGEESQYSPSSLPDIENIIFTSDSLEAIFVIGDSVYTWKPSEALKNADMDRLNWTSALFAAMTYELFVEDRNRPRDIESMLKRAIQNAEARSGVLDPLTLRNERSGSTADGEGGPAQGLGDGAEARLALSADGANNVARGHLRNYRRPVRGNDNQYRPRLRRSWKEIAEDWSSALSDLGIIGNELHIWRSQTDLPNYIACVDGKRAAIRAIWDKLHTFKMCRGASKSCSILIEADPGVGKTHLAKMFKEALSFEFIHRDITQMLHRDELLDVFDMVATKQAESDGGLVVFVDEINATLDGASVYGAFLSPIEAGFYMRRGIKFNLKPCIWMFAGTGEHRAAGNVATEKLADFNSRLSLLQRIDYRSLQIDCLQSLSDNPAPDRLKELYERLDALNKCLQKSTRKFPDPRKIIDALKEGNAGLTQGDSPLFGGSALERLVTLDRQARLEQVYLGALMINQAFCDVLDVERFLLEFFYQLDPSKAPARRIGRLVSQLQNVQYGQVSRANCTTDDWQADLKATSITDRSSDSIRLVLSPDYASRLAGVA